ncbi:MAG TPA: multiheme c-type cytochrome, partial [Myxococcales bacterium]|nr:multiheme c-type cytochrome [Myxococcales bacterium]
PRDPPKDRGQHNDCALRRPRPADTFRHLSMRLGFAVALLAAVAPVFASDLVGPESCRTCHPEAYRIWAQGPHARAVASLSADQRKSPLCLSCHSRDEQRSNPADPIVGVSCETCHGGGRYYQPALVMRDKELARFFGLQEAAATCTSCHGPGSPSAQPFDVKAALPRMDHWTAERARRQAGAQASIPGTRLAGSPREGR